MRRELKQKPFENSGTVFDGLYPGFASTSSREAGMVDLPGSGGAYFPGFSARDGTLHTFEETLAQGVFSSEEAQLIRFLPKERLARYVALELMAEDPTIDSAIKMHMAHALSARSDSGQVISIESITDDKNPIANDLRDTLQEKRQASLPALPRHTRGQLAFKAISGFCLLGRLWALRFPTGKAFAMWNR